MPNELILLAVGAMVAGFVQGLSGFAFGMVSMSFWVWGIEPLTAAVLAVFGSLMGQLIAALSSRRNARWAVLWPFLAGGMVGIPIGVALLPHVDAAMFKRVLGGLLLVWCPLMLVTQRLPRLTWGGAWTDAVVGAAGGVLGGIGGFTGVMPTLWCTLRGFDKDLQRAVIQNFNLAALSMTMTAYLATGAVTRDMLPKLGVVAVALLVPSVLGSRIYVGLSELAFRRVVLVLLTASGAAMWLSLLAPRWR